MYEYNAVVNRVVDGDTLDMTIDLGFGIKRDERIRLWGIDTPETYRPRNQAESEHGRAATARVRELVEGRTVRLLTEQEQGKYGRYLGSVRLLESVGEYPASADLSEILRAEGFEKREVY